MNTPVAAPAGGWRIYFERRALTLLALGFSAGLPIAMIFSGLSFWLVEAGIERKTITMFSWAALGYAFKFVWSPLVDALPLPVLTRTLGTRRAWLLTAQLLVAAAMVLMAFTDPSLPGQITVMAAGAVLLGFASATQDICIDAYRIEIAPDDSAMQTVMSSTYVMGYRLGMVASGMGVLFLAAKLGSAKGQYLYQAWQYSYLAMALLMAVGIATTLLMREPPHSREHQPAAAGENLRLVLTFVLAVSAFVLAFRLAGAALPDINNAPLTAFALETLRLAGALAAALATGVLAVKAGLVSAATAQRTWITPVTDFFKRYGARAALLLALIGLYRISDIVAGVISNVFYADLGFSKEDVALAVKTFGVVMMVVGGLAGGILAQRFAIMKMMMLGAVAASVTNLLFILLAQHGGNTHLLYWVVGFDNFAAGLASTVFVAFLSALTNIRFSAVQYALFSSLMTLFPKVLGGYSGAMVDAMGYEGFFGFTAALTLPVLLLIWLADKKIFSPQHANHSNL
ncbi:AmpG family muropeptide MFS transporter [Conchiformibius kuhniae]|uniref:MFS transporter n=1 Tax=Conchiformibius kuhniae TaxID=211502 RepID=A0A8T9MUN8_9NEIS|nr:MFS transporter [Conchiformibius kuhniae]UOP04931.1 MFS transporter [Conchiformibius kuhniae]